MMSKIASAVQFYALCVISKYLHHMSTLKDYEDKLLLRKKKVITRFIITIILVKFYHI